MTSFGIDSFRKSLHYYKNESKFKLYLIPITLLPKPSPSPNHYLAPRIFLAVQVSGFLFPATKMALTARRKAR